MPEPGSWEMDGFRLKAPPTTLERTGQELEGGLRVLTGDNASLLNPVWES